MRRVTDDHIRIRNCLHHPVPCPASLQISDFSFDLRISLRLLELLFQFLLGHPDLFLIIPSLIKIIKTGDRAEDQPDLHDHIHHKLQCIHRRYLNVHIHHAHNIPHIRFQSLIQHDAQDRDLQDPL